MKIDVLPDSDTVAREMAKFIAAEARAAILAWGRFEPEGVMAAAMEQLGGGNSR